MDDRPLDQVNRFVIVVVALVVIFLGLLVVLFAWAAPGGTIDRIADLAGWLRRHDDRETKAIISLVAAVIALMMLTAIVVELTPPSSQKMRVRNMTAGDARITTTQIGERIDVEVARVPHVAQCRSTVAKRGDRVDVVLDLQVGAGADLSQTADAACRRAQLFVEQQLGIELAARPRARLRYRELRLGTQPAAPPSGWERPQQEETRDQRGSPEPPEEAQA